MGTITGQMIHQAFQATTTSKPGWQEITPAAQQTYREMAIHLNALVELCPFCEFFEKPARNLDDGNWKIGDVSCCSSCASGPDISEMLLEWLEGQS